MQSIISAAGEASLDASAFGGKKTQGGKAGHMLQIFVRRDLVDELAHAAHPFGVLDNSRHPISEWLGGNNAFDHGQARLMANPEHFMDPAVVRMHVVSADPDFHARRGVFQRELASLFATVFPDSHAKERAARGLYGGALPEWFTTDSVGGIR